ncbi:cation transporter [bacterium]|nr:cation transporter [bacterium]
MNVEGMHCNACKILIEKSVNEIKNVSDVKANVRK